MAEHVASTTRSRRTGGTRSCWRRSSSSLLGAARVRDRLRRRPASRRAASPSTGDRDRRRRPGRRSGRTSAGDSLVLAGRGARGGRRGRRAAADERRPELAIAANVPMPQGLPHRRHGAERLRDRPRPEARLGRDHDRAAREARPRGAPGRHRPRALARPQLRHPVLAARRRAGRARSRCSPTSSCASRSGAAAGAAGDRDSGGGGGLQADRLRHRDRPGDPRADRRPPRPAGGQPPARVPGRRLGRRADPQPVRPGAGAGQDLGRPGARSRSPTGRPSTSTS